MGAGKKLLPVIVMALMALAFAGPSTAHAHGAGWQVIDNSHTNQYRFGYTDGSAMAFAEVIVTAPNGKTWQKGRTDRTGHFAFGVDRDSLTKAMADTVSNGWKIHVADGMGHVVNLTYHLPSVDENGNADEASATAPKSHIALQGTSALFDLPTWVGALFGLSILVNVFGGMFLWSRRRARTTGK